MKIIRASLAFSSATFISRIAGYLRDAGIAYFFGSSTVTDAFFIAFRLPNTLRRIIGEGGFNAVFVPLYAQSIKKGEDKEFLSRIFSFYMGFIILLTLLGILLSKPIVYLLAPGFAGTETSNLAVYIAKWLFLYLPFIAVSSYFMGVLNTHKEFFIPAFSQAVFNITMLLLLILFAERFSYYSLIAGVLAGGIFQVLIYTPAIFKLKISIKLSFVYDEKVKSLVKRLVPSTISFGISQISFFVDTILASFIGTGAISYIYYANRIFQLPLGLFSVGAANSLLSFISSGGDEKESTKLTSGMIFLLIFPSSLGLIVLSLPVVSFLYRRGEFTFEDAIITSSILSIYSVSLIFFSLQKLTASIFFARGDTVTPAKVTAIYVFSEALFSLIFAFGLKLGLYGLPLGTLVASIISFFFIYRKVEYKFLKYVRETIIKAFIASIFMALILKFISISLEMSYLLQVIFLIPLGALIYGLILLILKEPLTHMLLKRVLK